MEIMKHTIYITSTAYSLPYPFLQLGLKVGKCWLFIIYFLCVLE